MLITRPEFWQLHKTNAKANGSAFSRTGKHLDFFGLLLKAISVRNLAHEVELSESSSCDLFFFCDVIVIVILLLFEVLLGIFYYLCVCLFVLFVCLFTFNLVETWLSFPKTRRLNAISALIESSIFLSLLLK